MAAVSFTSVGVLSTDRRFQTEVNQVPIGLKTPLSLGQSSDGILAMHFDLSSQIQDNLKNLLLTNWGDRLAFYDYGANLSELVFELSSDKFDLEVMRRIKGAVSKWMPFVELLSFDKEILGRQFGVDVAHIKLKITYAVPKLGISNKGLELSFYVGG